VIGDVALVGGEDAAWTGAVPTANPATKMNDAKPIAIDLLILTPPFREGPKAGPTSALPLGCDARSRQVQVALS
jgi:hypothetical protein